MNRRELEHFSDEQKRRYEPLDDACVFAVDFPKNFAPEKTFFVHEGRKIQMLSGEPEECPRYKYCRGVFLDHQAEEGEEFVYCKDHGDHDYSFQLAPNWCVGRFEEDIMLRRY